jgi:hypothetical protein
MISSVSRIPHVSGQYNVSEESLYDEKSVEVDIEAKSVIQNSKERTYSLIIEALPKLQL